MNKTILSFRNEVILVGREAGFETIHSQNQTPSQETWGALARPVLWSQETWVLVLTNYQLCLGCRVPASHHLPLSP